MPCLRSDRKGTPPVRRSVLEPVACMTYREQDDEIMRTDSTCSRWLVLEALGLLAPSPPAAVVSERCVVSRSEAPARVDAPDVPLVDDPLRVDESRDEEPLDPESRRPLTSTC